MAKKGITISTKPIKSLQAKFDTEKLKVLLKAEVEGYAFNVVAVARDLAPVNFGQLKNSIGSEPVEDFKTKVFVGADYGAYVEFGTGAKVKVPIELRAIAEEYKGPTGRSFEDGVKSIGDWLEAKGGDREDAKFVLLKILAKGIEPQPYLYPALVRGRRNFIASVKNLIKNLDKQ